MVYVDLPPQSPAVEIAQSTVEGTAAERRETHQSSSESQSNHRVGESGLEGAATSTFNNFEADNLGGLLSTVVQPASEDILDRLLAPAEADRVRQASAVSMALEVLTAHSSSDTSDNGLERSQLPSSKNEEGLLVLDNLLPVSPDSEDSRSDDEIEDSKSPVQIDLETDDGLTVEEFTSQLQLTADFQEYDPESQVITARGNVLLRLNDAVIEANEIWLNLVNRYALATGDVLLTRGAQIVRGSRAEYNFIQQAGVMRDAAGTLYLPQAEEDLGSPLEPLSDTSRRIYDPIRRDTAFEVLSEGSVRISTNDAARPTGGSSGGNLRQLRFETDELIFDVEGWRAQAVRITNDPFSPPELELRTDSLVLRNISPTQDELRLKRPRLVFDQGLAVPLFRDRILFNRGTVNPSELNPVPVGLGIDGADRGGFFIGRKVPVVRNEQVRLSLTPQYFVNRAFSSDSDSPLDPQNFGVVADLTAQLTPKLTLTGSVDLTSLELSQFTENLRTNIRAEQLLGDHRLALQYSYRERLFNGSLGFQDVQSSFGAVLLSPDIDLNDRGLRLTYQAGAQLINAETDRTDLLESRGSNTGRVTLGRFQASAALRQGFDLWRGESKPATQEEGLRFTPEPIVPSLNLSTGLRATGTYYSSSDFQNSLIADISLNGQLGHLSRNFGDYTRFNIGYSQSVFNGDDSPFLFDREVDRNVLSLGLTQQIYGPFIAGFQTALSFNADSDIDTSYILEYSRRTYGILLRYDASQQTGAIGFRLSNFSWIGDSDPFDTPRLRRVQSGVIEQ
ncbi:MAG: DUF3769 domain-containing protein [Cyanobacteria bacterium P01_F01_bin.53]